MSINGIDARKALIRSLQMSVKLSEERREHDAATREDLLVTDLLRACKAASVLRDIAVDRRVTFAGLLARYPNFPLGVIVPGLADTASADLSMADLVERRLRKSKIVSAYADQVGGIAGHRPFCWVVPMRGVKGGLVLSPGNLQFIGQSPLVFRDKEDGMQVHGYGWSEVVKCLARDFNNWSR